MSIDFDRPVQTRDGCEVRIYTTEGAIETHPVVGEYLSPSGDWLTTRWEIDGSVEETRSPKRNLVNVPQQYNMSLNIYRKAAGEIYTGLTHLTRARADNFAVNDRIACIEVTFHEGEGL